MVKISTILVVSFASLVCASPLHVQERRSEGSTEYANLGPAPIESTLALRLALVPNNMDGLHQKLYEISMPGSVTYRQWLSKEEVEAYVAPSSDSSSSVKSWLSANGISYKTVSPAGDWIGVNVSVGRANSLLNARFSTFKHKETGQEIVRTLSYSVPAFLKGHLDFVHPTITFPVKPIGGPKVISKSSKSPSPPGNGSTDTAPSTCGAVFTPLCAQELYGIPTTFATHSENQLNVAGFNNLYASQSDLELFLETYRPDLAGESFSVELLDGGQNDQSSPGLEADLDIQYTVGIASNATINFVSVGQHTVDNVAGFLDIINLFLSQDPTPNVFSTSYGFNEAQNPFSVANNLCNAYAQLGARGTTIVFSSGDGGVGGIAQTGGGINTGNCTTFVPTFPSSCPFVTSVGATEDIPEIAAPFSSGGFSNDFSTPSYQTDAVSSYLIQLGSQYTGLYNASGRGFPDISAAGVDYVVAFAGDFELVAGTSCSAPLFASIIALIDDELAGRGQPPLGFLNPLIYSTPQAFTDILLASNPGCGTQGFSALTGWDPVTGVGSPMYSALRTAAGL